MIAWGHFFEFLNALSINTKERGVVYLGQTLLGTQKRFLQEVKIGMDMGVREFVTLKCRQIGISTVSLALDIYWLGMNMVQGAIVVHDEAARDQFRAILQMYMDGLPEEWQLESDQHNRNQLVLENGSMFQYKVAGVKESSTKSLGRSSAISFGHFTEVAFWGDPSQISSLKSSMAEENPNRFFNWETTANGYNHFNDMWNDAHGSVSVRPIFITWWSNEFYRARRDTIKWKQYWGHKARPTEQERDWIKQVKEDFDHDLDDEQLAWYRWNRAEKVTDEEDLYQEFPTTPEDAFQATGSKFFTGKSLNMAFRRVLGEPKPKMYRFQFGEDFTDTNLIESPEKNAHLKIWEEPQTRDLKNPNSQMAYYAIGADPAYGSSETADRYVVQVFRAYANKLVQVAEFCVVDLSTYTFAWVICYLCGCYQPNVYNIEVNGPGGAVIQEIDNLKRLAGKALLPGQSKTMMDVVRKMQEFLYVRPDSVTQRPQGKHTLTTANIKDSYMSMMRDNFERGVLEIHSRPMLDEMKSVIRDGIWIGAEGDGKDDRVIGGALATKAWNDSLRQRLINSNVVWVPEEQRTIQTAQSDSVAGRMIRGYLQQIGAVRKQEAEKRVAAYNTGRK
jgi:hypothetical protein